MRFGLFVLFLLAAMAGDAEARERRQIDATPFSHAPCSVFDHGPCTPSYCSIFNHGPCIPEIDYPYGQNLQLTIQTVPPEAEAARYQRPDHDLDSIGDLFAALRSCWSPPPEDVARAGMQMSIRFSFKRSGAMIATPRVTFATSGAPADVRATYLKAITNSLESCLPLKFTSTSGRPSAAKRSSRRSWGAGSSI